MRRLGWLVLALALLLTVAACGDDDDATGDTGGGDSALTVYGAASLTEVFPAIDPAPQYSFAGSDELDGPAHELGNCIPHLFDENGLARAAARIRALAG